jgi:hypothetical protein
VHHFPPDSRELASRTAPTRRKKADSNLLLSQNLRSEHCGKSEYGTEFVANVHCKMLVRQVLHCRILYGIEECSEGLTERGFDVQQFFASPSGTRKSRL